MIGEESAVAADNKNDYGTKSPLEKKRRTNIVRDAIRTFIQKSNVDFVARR
jgi:hypothetical protein